MLKAQNEKILENYKQTHSDIHELFIAAKEEGNVLQVDFLVDIWLELAEAIRDIEAYGRTTKVSASTIIYDNMELIRSDNNLGRLYLCWTLTHDYLNVIQLERRLLAMIKDVKMKQRGM